MSTRTLSIISAALTALLIFLFGLILFFGLIVALNGFGEREGMTAIMISLICQGIGLILSAVLAGRLSRLFIQKFNWNRILAVAASVFAGLTLGGALAVAAVFISIFAAEGMR